MTKNASDSSKLPHGKREDEEQERRGGSLATLKVDQD